MPNYQILWPLVFSISISINVPSLILLLIITLLFHEDYNNAFILELSIRATTKPSLQNKIKFNYKFTQKLFIIT